MRALSLSALLAGLTLLSPMPASAADPSGTWLRESGASRVRFSKCGDAFCGTIVWLKDANGPAKVGQRVFFDMKGDGANRWTGKAFNPEDGKTYSGKMLLNGDKLLTEGCALAGLVCRSVNWSKVN